MARSLAVFRQCFKCLVNESDVSFNDVQSKQTKSAGRAATDAVQKLQSLADNVVVVLVTLRPQVILQLNRTRNKELHSSLHWLKHKRMVSSLQLSV